MQPFSGNQRPDLLTSLMNMSLALRLPCDMHLSTSSSNVPRLPSSWKFYNTLTFFCSLLARCRIPCACHAKPHLNLQKWSEHVVFLHLDVEMCFAPQRRALFRHRNFQKCSEREVLSTFWLRNVLRATTACTFSSSQLPKVVWDRQFFTLLTSKRASRHNGVQFFISHLARWHRTRRFSELTFRPSGATNHWKIAVNRDFSTCSRTCIFFPLTLSLLWSSFFFSSLLWRFPPLPFSICPFCRKYETSFGHGLLMLITDNVVYIVCYDML